MTNILLAGVGGQGTVLASKLLARAAMDAGLNVRIRGAKDSQSATVISQSVEAGTKVARGTVIEISIVHTDITDG